jgi:hypothetical protein
MDNINNNKDIILKWFYKQVKKDDVLKGIPKLGLYGKNTTTVGVTTEYLNFIKNNIDIAEEPILIKVNPLLPRNLCHYNCRKMIEILNKNSSNYVWKLGYNITACPCGKFFTTEIHSVLYHLPTTTYIDLTEDFGGEKEKWFIPLNFDTISAGLINFLQNMAKVNLYCSMKEAHDCFDCYTYKPLNSYICGLEEIKTLNNILKIKYHFF